eukprot:TRINITY_DN19624_c0_g2_i1.p4 TRINITY_DN19624_c0_g2~~TRINITY_DN19624_c0_g2_i1.p4  ORF type:complete len:117 (-),score=6.05 TRINITY_DN19624_c0_g2_i1:18-368(-)
MTSKTAGETERTARCLACILAIRVGHMQNHTYTHRHTQTHTHIHIHTYVYTYTYTSVSYTHLTLPTICSVQISVVAVSLKKKKNQLESKINKKQMKLTTIKSPHRDITSDAPQPQQ